MRFRDVLATAFSGLLQQRLRTLLTLAGVTVGALLLSLSLSGGLGVLEAVTHRLKLGDRLLQVHVYAGGWDSEEEPEPADLTRIPGEMSPERRRRLALAWREENPAEDDNDTPLLLTSEMLDRLERIPHVRAVVPDVSLFRYGHFGESSEHTRLMGLPAADTEVHKLIVAGRPLADDSEQGILVHEYLAYRFGVIDEGDVPGFTGKSVRFEERRGAGAFSWALRSFGGGDVELSTGEMLALDGALEDLVGRLDELGLTPEQEELLRKALGSSSADGVDRPGRDEPTNSRSDEAESRTQAGGAGAAGSEAQSDAMPDRVLSSTEYKVVGVFRSPTAAEMEQGAELHAVNRHDVILPIRTAREEWEAANAEEHAGFWQAVVRVDSAENVRGVVEEIRETDLSFWSLVDTIDRVRSSILLITSVITAVAAAAFAIAALGMTNTMVMNVMERRREIGILKALGGRDRDVLSVFLVEGMLVGVLGGLAGLVLSWVVSLACAAHVRRLLESEFHETFDETLFIFPVWLTLGTPALAAFVTTLSSLLPARRAARIDPVATLRQE